MALQVYPRNGRPFNQLAIIAFCQVRRQCHGSIILSSLFLTDICSCGLVVYKALETLLHLKQGLVLFVCIIDLGSLFYA